MAANITDIPFPAGGIDRNWALSKEPSTTTPYALNVRPYSTDAERCRGGSRPGLVRAEGVVANLAGGIQWMGSVDGGAGDGTTFECDFEQYPDGQLSDPDVAGTDWEDADSDLYVKNGYAHVDVGGTEFGGAALSSCNHVGDVNFGEFGEVNSVTFNDFQMAATVSANQSTDASWTWTLGGTHPAVISLEITWDEYSTFAGTGRPTWTFTAPGYKTSFRFPDPAFWSPTFDIKVEFMEDYIDIEVDSHSPFCGKKKYRMSRPKTAGVANTYSHVSMAMTCGRPYIGADRPAVWAVDSRIHYMLFNTFKRPTEIRRRLIVAAGGSLYREAHTTNYATPVPGTLTTSAVGSGLGSNALIDAAPCNGRLYLVNGAAPQVYDPDPDGAGNATCGAWTASKGKLQNDCTIIRNWRNRIVMAGSVKDPQNWFMSRMDHPWDWDYGKEDSMSAVAGNFSELGRIGDPITAIIPWSDNMLIFGCRSSVWVMNGDPMEGGVVNRALDIDGVCHRNAWCIDDDGVIYFLGYEGFYAMMPGGRANDLAHTRVPELCAKLPISGAGASGQWYQTVVYDATRHVVLILQQPYTATDAPEHWLYDIRTKSFWKEKYGDVTTHPSMRCAYYYPSTYPPAINLLLGGDSMLYAFSDAAKQDAFGSGPTNVAISSALDFRPVRLAGPIDEGVLMQLRLATGTDASGGTSDPVTVQVFTGRSPQASNLATTPAYAVASYPYHTNKTMVGRTRAGAHRIRVSNTTINKAWSLESVSAVFEKGGAQGK